MLKFKNLVHLPNNQPVQLLSLIGFVAIIVGVAFRVSIGEDFIYNIWTDRDLWRGVNLATDFQVTGSEMGGTAAHRTPGGLQSYVYYLMYGWGADPDTLWWLVILSFFAATCVLIRTLDRYANTTVALLSAGVLLTSYTTHEEMLHLWNPAFATVLMILAYCLLLKIILENRGQLIAWLILISALAAQYHLSAFLMIAAAILLIFCFRIKVGWQTWLLGALLFLISYAPFIYNEVANGYPWFSEALRWRGELTNLDRISGDWGRQTREFFSVVGNLYRLPFSPIFGDVPRTGFALIGFLILIAASNVIIIGMVVYFVAFIVKCRKCGKGELDLENIDRISIVNAALSIFFAVVFIISAAELSRRRLVPLIPVGAVVAAIALHFVIGQLIRIRSLPIRRLMIGVASATILFGLVFPLWHWSELHPHWPRYGGLKTLVFEFKEGVSSRAEDFRNRVALLSDSPSPRFIPSKEIPSGQFAVEVLLRKFMIGADSPAPTNSPACVAVMANEVRLTSSVNRIDGGVYPEKRPEGEKRDIVKIARNLLPSAAAGQGQDIAILKAVAKTAYTFVVYRTQDGNCVKTFVDPYVLTEEERQVAAFRQPLVGPSSEADVKPFDPPTGAIGAFAFDLSNVFGPRSVLIHRDANGVYVSLHGRGSRGYQGFGSDYLKDPVVRFVSLSGGGAFDLLIGKAEIGEGVKLTPWRSKVLSLPEGSYKVILEAARLKSRTRKVENWSVVLSENLGVH